MRQLVVNGNKIGIDLLSLVGTETIYYNGEIVSKKTSLGGGVHAFSVKENGDDATYTIKVGMGFPIRATVVIKRNDELIYADDDLSGTEWIKM